MLFPFEDDEVLGDRFALTVLHTCSCDCDDGYNFIPQMIVHPAHNRWDQVGDEVPTPTLRTYSQHRRAQDSDDARLNRPGCSAIFRINAATP